MEGGKISLALGGVKKAPPPKPGNGVKRSHASLREDDDEEDETDRPQKVSHFDKAAGGAIGDSQPQAKGPMVIAPQANRDWRDSSKRQKSRKGLPADAQNGQMSEQAMKEFEEKVEKEKPQFGLNVKTLDRANVQTLEAADESLNLVGSSSLNDEKPVTNGEAMEIADASEETQIPVTKSAQTDDEEAMEALFSGDTKKQDLVLPAMSEEEAFTQDFRSAPDMASLEDYDRVPVEQFGAALLRGMGWKDGEGIGAQRGKKVVTAKVPEKRPALLGIGAKEEAAVAQEMGSWGRAAKDRKGAPQIYNPILLRDKKTGEMFTEEELQKKKERQQREQYEVEFEQKERKKRRDNGKEDDRERRHGKESKRHSSRDRDRNGDDEEYSSRRRDKERERRRKEEEDEDYYRRKEKDRKRRDRERDGGRDSERSHRHDSGRDNRKDYDRRR